MFRSQMVDYRKCALFAGAFSPLRARLEASFSCFNRQPKISFLHFAYDCRKSPPARVERRSKESRKIEAKSENRYIQSPAILVRMAAQIISVISETKRI